jgi:hypothetical protein
VDDDDLRDLVEHEDDEDLGASRRGVWKVIRRSDCGERAHQCRKCRWPVKTMASPAASAAAITSASLTDPPGWITAVAPASAAARRPSGKGKKASEATTEPSRASRAAQFLGHAAGLERGDGGAVEPAHLPGADAHGRAALRVDDGVRLDVLGDRPGEEEVGEFGRGRRALRHDLEVGAADRPASRSCTRKPPATCRKARPGAAGSARPPGRQEAEVLLGGEDGPSPRRRRRGR